MTSIPVKCLNAIRALPLESGFDLPWSLMEEYRLTNGSLVFPILDISIDNITQTAGRVVFALMLLNPFCKLIALCNTALGTVHLVWCVCNIKGFRDKTIDRAEFEKAFIRLSTAVYDVALVFFLSTQFIGSSYIHGALLLSLALSPQQVVQLHHAIFAKAKIPGRLKEECLIQVFAKGMTDTILPPETLGWGSRLLSLPAGLGSYTMSAYRSAAAMIFRTK